MEPKSYRGTTRPLTDRLNAAIAWLMTGSSDKAEELCGIPSRTIREWMNEPSWEELMNIARKQKQSELDSKFTKIIHKAVEEICDRLDNGDEVVSKNGEIVRKRVSAREGAWIASVLADKRSILRGEPTSISKRTNTGEHLKDVKAELEKEGQAIDPGTEMNQGKVLN